MRNHENFVRIWQVCETADLAAAVLGRNVQSVIDQADFLRKSGVTYLRPVIRHYQPDYDLGLPDFAALNSNPPPSWVTVLTEQQKDIFYNNLQTAVEGAYAQAQEGGGVGRQAIRTASLDDAAFEQWARRVSAGNLRKPRTCAWVSGKYAAIYFFSGAYKSTAEHFGGYIYREPVSPLNSTDRPFISPKDELWAARKELLSEFLAPTGGRLPTSRYGYNTLATSLGLDGATARKCDTETLKSHVEYLIALRILERLTGREPALRKRVRKRSQDSTPCERFVLSWLGADCVVTVTRAVKQPLTRVLEVGEQLKKAGVSLPDLPMRVKRAPRIRLLEPSLS